MSDKLQSIWRYDIAYNHGLYDCDSKQCCFVDWLMKWKNDNVVILKSCDYYIHEGCGLIHIHVQAL